VQLIVQIHKFQELGEKYRIEFKSRENHSCVVRFDFAGYGGASTTLMGAERPFVLREFNSDEDVFKAVRPQQAEINVLNNIGNLSIDNFIADTDQEITVYFDFGVWTNYWIGYLLQDDFQEVWQDTIHIITLRASDYIGQLKNIPLSDNGTDLIGRFTPFEIIGYALDNTPQNLVRARIINNLFHSSMTAGIGYMPLNQCNIDAKTFQKSDTEYDDCYTTIEKINKSFNQTLFMYDGYWRFLRIEELYRPFSQNLTELYLPLTGPVGANIRYDANIGVNESIKPISSEMLRYIIRRTKIDTINFRYDVFDEIVTNESFSKGTLLYESAVEEAYTLDNWDHLTGSLFAPTPVPFGNGKKNDYNTLGQLTESYAFLENDTANAEHFIKSLAVKVLINETISITYQKRYSVGFSVTRTVGSGYVRLTDGTLNYWLNDEGGWDIAGAGKIGEIEYNGVDNLITTEYQSLTIESKQMPISGDLTVYLLGPNSAVSGGSFTVPSEVIRYQNLEVKVIPTFLSFTDNRLSGIQSIFTKPQDIVQRFEDEIFMDDFSSGYHKGTIFESDGVTLTSKEWARGNYPTEVIGFRKQNAIAHVEHNLYNRTKVDANFYGLTWERSGAEYPIGLINTFKFVDDDPNKVYWILNLKEIDFSNSTWSATLIEMFNQGSDKDAGTTVKYLEVNTTIGTFNALVYAKLNFVLAADFSINSNFDQITYNGTIGITVPITANLSGYINSNTSSPVTISLVLNTTTIASQSISVPSNPFPFNAVLNVASVTINPGDVLFIQYSSNITQVEVNGGGIDLNYTTANAIGSTSYKDKFIYQ
jgi:hypothetical protein